MNSVGSGLSCDLVRGAVELRELCGAGCVVYCYCIPVDCDLV